MANINKNKFNNFKNSVNAVTQSYFDSELVSPIDDSLFEIGQSQFESLCEMFKEKNKCNYLSEIVMAFKLSDEEIITLLKINSSSRDNDNNYRLKLIEKLSDEADYEKILEIIKENAFNMEYFVGASDENNFSRTLLEKFVTTKKPFEELELFFNKIRDDFLSIINTRIWTHNKNLKESKEKNDPNVIRPNFIVSANQFIDIEGEGIKMELSSFRERITSTFINLCEFKGITIPKEFVFKNNEDIEVEYLLKYYDNCPEDALACEKIKNFLQTRCERVIRHIFGPCSSLIKINIDWDVDSMVLFNKMSEDKEEDSERI